jgi:hypothetical protein
VFTCLALDFIQIKEASKTLNKCVFRHLGSRILLSAAFKKEWRERGKNWRFPEIWARRAFFNGENGKENGSYTCNAL